MVVFSIFRNKENGRLAAVYDYQLPTPTGIGRLEKWERVYHGWTTGFLDKAKQLKAYKEGMKKNEV